MVKMNVELSKDPAKMRKISIIESTVEQDKHFVAFQWMHTFKTGNKNHAAKNIAKLIIAGISQGDFKTKSALASPDLTYPSKTLSAIDYVSHASRVIFDYKNLNPENRQEFLAYFPEAGQRGVVARSATHAVVRKGDTIEEQKGFMLGVTGLLPTFLKTPNDFGVNIPMGGEDRDNFIGNIISDNGFSGHMYFHHNAQDSLLMAGLEQSAPASNAYEAIFGHRHSAVSVQQGSDQFGQAHSLTGASDTYTAAGSLYFSDPLYQAKLLAETATLPPDKYGAMQVTLTDGNWLNIKQFLVNLNISLDSADSAWAFEQFVAAPMSAIATPQTIQSYISIDFKAYLKSIEILLEQVPMANIALLKSHLSPLQIDLLNCIKQLQQGKMEAYKPFQEIVQKISTLDALPKGYRVGIERIQQLFTLQLQKDPELQQTHINILIEQRCSELLDTITALEEKAKILGEYFSSAHISQENGVGIFLGTLRVFADNINNIKDVVVRDTKDVSLDDLASYQDEIQSFSQFLNEPPRLVSESFLLKANETIKNQQDALEIQQQALDHLHLQFELKNREVQIQQQALDHLIPQLELKNREVQRQQQALDHLGSQLESKDQEVQRQQQTLEHLGSQLESKDQEVQRQQQTSDLQKMALISLAPVFVHLKQVNDQAKLLANRGYMHESELALQLSKNIHNEIDIYLKHVDEHNMDEALETLKIKSQEYIDKVTPVLERHRGWKQILGNLAACIIGLVVGYVIAGVINKLATGQFFFFNQTESMRTVNGLQESLIKCNPT